MVDTCAPAVLIDVSPIITCWKPFGSGAQFSIHPVPFWWSGLWSGSVSRPCKLGGQPRRERGERPTKKARGRPQARKGVETLQPKSEGGKTASKKGSDDRPPKR